MGWCDVAPAHRFFWVVHYAVTRCRYEGRYEDGFLAARAFASGPSEKVGLTTGSAEVSRSGKGSEAWGWENKLEESMGMSLVERKYCGETRGNRISTLNVARARD